MTDEELLKRLRPLSWSDIDARFGVPMDETMREAADRIEQLGKACAEWADVSQSNYQRAKAAETKLAENEVRLSKAVGALRKLHHAACGETGFAACVRLDIGLAYPWPALDEADEMTRALLAEIEGEKG